MRVLNRHAKRACAVTGLGDSRDGTNEKSGGRRTRFSRNSNGRKRFFEEELINMAIRSMG